MDRQKKYRLAHPERYREYARRSRLKHLAKRREEDRIRAQRPARKAAKNASSRKSYAADPKKHCTRTTQYRAAVEPEIRRARDRRGDWKRKGMPLPTREMPSVCDCCGGPPNGKGRLHLDHDHHTGEFRGWLCWLCNTAIGKLGDNIEGLRKAIAYLERACSKN